MLGESLQKKVDFAIKLLQSAEKKAAEVGQPVEICYSGGKDSDVILELAKMAGINYRAIYKNTTIDPPGTIKHCKEKGVEIVNPSLSFFKIVEKESPPTMRARICCKHLKEYKILDVSVQGIRRCESEKRKENYQEPTICRIYSNKKNAVEVFLPILQWDNEDVKNFIEDRGIKCHPLYYDNQMNFHVERRLGCLGCLLKSDRGVSDYKRYPKLLKQLVIATKKWLETHPDAESATKFGDAYRITYHNLFCKSYEDFQYRMQPTLFGDIPDCRKLLEGYFGINLDLD